jgi:hypothetical protein
MTAVVVPHQADRAAELRDVVDDIIFHASRTAGDPSNAGRWPAIPERVQRYLVRSVADSLWINHLALAAAILSAVRLDPSTTLGYVVTLHTRFKELFPALGLSTIAEWKPSRHIPMYLRGEILVDHSDYMRVHFRGA